MEPIRINFTLNQQEIDRAVRFGVLRQGSFRFYFLTAVVVALIVLSIVYRRTGLSSDFVLLVSIFAGLGLLPFILRFQTANNRASKIRQDWSFDETEILQSSEHGQGQFTWNFYHGFRESGDEFYLFLTSNSGSFHIIPKRALQLPDLERFRSLLQSRLQSV
jgi:hypothetical protein